MIYLFEDRKGRMKQYIDSKLDTNYLKQSVLDCDAKGIDALIKNSFIDASCVLLHKSYNLPSSDLTIEMVKNAFLNNDIPVIYFSGGLKNNIVIEKRLVCGTVNSGDMYNNLNIFIKEYIEKGKINVPLLIFGKKYLLNSLLGFQHNIVLKLFDKTSDYVLTSDEIDEIIDIAILRMREPELSDDKNKLIEWLKRSMNKKSLTVQLLYSQIQRLIDKY